MLALMLFAVPASALWMGDVVSGSDAELLGLEVGWDGVRVSAVVPYGVEPSGDLVLMNVSVGAALYLDIDYDPETGIDYIIGPGYVLKGVDAVLVMNVSYNWSLAAGPIISENHFLVVFNSPRGFAFADASGLVSGSMSVDGALFTVDWAGLPGLYEQLAGSPASRVYRVYVVAEEPVSSFFNASAGVSYRAVDSAVCGPASVAGVSVELTGSPSDWPASARICEDVMSQGIPGFSDLVAVYLSNDGQSVYLGFERTGMLDVDAAAWAVFGDLYIDNDGDNVTDAGSWLGYFAWADKERLGMSYRTGPGPSLVSATIEQALLDTIVVEAKASASNAPQGLAPDAQIAGGTVTLETMVMDLLAPRSGAVIADLVVDTVNSTLIDAGALYTVLRATIQPGAGPIVVESGGAKLVLPGVPAPVLVQLGRTGVPPYRAGEPGYEPVAYYYFSVNDTNRTGWPLKLVIPYNGSAKPLVYSYDKAAGAYTPVPPELVSWDKANGTITVTVTEELYQKGDPAIAVYTAEPTIGGTLVPQQETGYGALLAITILGVVALGVWAVRRTS